MFPINSPSNVPVAHHADLLYTPSFWDDKKAYAWYSPDIEGAFIEGVEYRRKNKLKSADELAQDGTSNIAMLTDLQNDFRDAGRLPVKGTDDVVLKTCIRLLNGTVANYFTGVVFSQDGHPAYHISYSDRWRTLKNQPFDLRVNKAAVLDLVDPAKGIFRATCFNPADGSPIDMGFIQSMINIKDTVAYWNYLQQTGQGPVWVFATHCKLGSDGVDSHPLIVEVLAFMEGARLLSPVPVYKGHIRDTDWFGPLQPCRPDPTHPQGGFQKPVVDLFETVTGLVEFYGVAQDFCNYYMQKQVMDHFEGTPFFKKMAFALDGTAAIVPNAPHVEALYKTAKAKGVNFFMTGDDFSSAA